VPFIKHVVRELPKPPAQCTDPSAAEQFRNSPTYPVAATHHVLRVQGQVTHPLPRVTCPTFVVASRIDHSLHPHSAQYAYDCTSLDSEWQQVTDETVHFITIHAAARNLG
jgi:esterase/lipase